MLIGRSIKTYLRNILVAGLAASIAYGGTVSPQFAHMDPNQNVQVIVEYSPNIVGLLTSTVCGVLNLIKLLPGGELCSMTVSAATLLGLNPGVAHVSVNNPVLG